MYIDPDKISEDLPQVIREARAIQSSIESNSSKSYTDPQNKVIIDHMQNIHKNPSPKNNATTFKDFNSISKITDKGKDAMDAMTRFMTSQT